MKDLNIEDLKQLLSDGIQARQYAWDHYEELLARKPAYTLYGPYDYWIGAATPEKIISKASRVLTFKTRKKSYLIYELDSEYKLLRVKHVFQSKPCGTYHFFELDGIQYAVSFRPNKKELGHYEIYAIGYKDGKPYYYGNLYENRVLAYFFEYVSPDKRHVTQYQYDPTAEYSLYGYPADSEAPLGEPNSRAHRFCYDEKPIYTDFSKFFTETETAEEQKKEESENPKISDWIDNILNTDIPDDIAAFCFNLYEDGNGSWSMELIGAGRFDAKDSDWPCDEITDFNSRTNRYEWEMDCSWKKALTYVTKELKEYLANGKYAELLKSRKGVGVGFVDGDLKILA